MHRHLGRGLVRCSLRARQCRRSDKRRCGLGRRAACRLRAGIVTGNRFAGRGFACRSRQRSQRTGLRSEEHTSELQSLMRISYAVFCLKKKKKTKERKVLKENKSINSKIYKYKEQT